jgi:hypothetical protein
VQFVSLLSLNDSQITTTAQDGNGGAIRINGGGTLQLTGSALSTSVFGFAGDGGNIDITVPVLVMNGGFIQANTAAANASGGTVSINVQTLLPSGNAVFIGGSSALAFQRGVSAINVIQAAAPTGVSGTVNVSTPALDLSGTLAALDLSAVPATGPARNLCQARGGSSFVEAGRGALPASGRGMLNGRRMDTAPTRAAAATLAQIAVVDAACRP